MPNVTIPHPVKGPLTFMIPSQIIDNEVGDPYHTRTYQYAGKAVFKEPQITVEVKALRRLCQNTEVWFMYHMFMDNRPIMKRTC